MSAPEAEALSGRLLAKSGPFRAIHTKLSWQLSRLLCARGEWPPCRCPRSGVTSSRRKLFSGTGSFVHIGSRTALPLPRWPRGRDSWIGQLQRSDGIDQARAEIVVALAGREPLRARGQDAANVSRGQFRIAFQQQRHDAAHLGRRDATAVEPVVGRFSQARISIPRGAMAARRRCKLDAEVGSLSAMNGSTVLPWPPAAPPPYRNVEVGLKRKGRRAWRKCHAA